MSFVVKQGDVLTFKEAIADTTIGVSFVFMDGCKVEVLSVSKLFGILECHLSLKSTIDHFCYGSFRSKDIQKYVTHINGVPYEQPSDIKMECLGLETLLYEKNPLLDLFRREGTSVTSTQDSGLAAWLPVEETPVSLEKMETILREYSEFKNVYGQPIPFPIPTCQHEYKQYVGLTESFNYCVKCDHKR